MDRCTWSGEAALPLEVFRRVPCYPTRFRVLATTVDSLARSVGGAGAGPGAGRIILFFIEVLLETRRRTLLLHILEANSRRIAFRSTKCTNDSEFSPARGDSTTRIGRVGRVTKSH